MGLKNFSTVLYRLWRGGFKKVAFTNFRPDRHILSRADGRSENLGLVMCVGGGQNPPPLVLMVRVNWSDKIWRGRNIPPCPQVPPSLLRHILIHLPLLSFRVIKMALGTTSILQCTLYTGTHWSLLVKRNNVKGYDYKVRIHEMYDLI